MQYYRIKLVELYIRHQENFNFPFHFNREKQDFSFVSD